MTDEANLSYVAGNETFIKMDDFDLILGNAFMRTAGVGVFPQLGGVLIMDKAGACFVRG